MEKLFWELFNVNYEKEIHKIIDQNEVLENPKNWHPYGGSTGNFGTFESQQYHPVPALVEKITNSIDAMLIKECKTNKIDPKSQNAPKSMKEAVEIFYKVKNGEIAELGAPSRRELAENIQIIANGDRQQPSILVYDDGEGQEPENFYNTFLSLHNNNKTDIKFVQGKYNMGSTGAVVFCGDNKYQLIASKKSIDINNKSDFGFTLIRRHPLPKSESQSRATWYEYFAPEGKIPSFAIEELDLGLHKRKFRSGSIVKLYSYQLPRGSRSEVTLDLWRELNQYMFNLCLPVVIVEKRFPSTKTPSKPLLGNRTRIAIDDRNNVEKIILFNIPKNSEIGEVNIEVVIFDKSVEHKEFIHNKSLIYTLNGQVHGFEGQSFISQDLGFQMIKKHMLIHVDCSNIPTYIRQDLFMSNRTHLKENTRANILKDNIIKVLRNSEQLRRINNERKNAIFQESKSDKELLKDMLSKLPVDNDVLELLKRDGQLDFLKVNGNKNKKNERVEKKKKFNRFPSIFNLNHSKNGKLYKTIPLNSHGTVKIETDVEDDYLFRPNEKGLFEIEILQKRNNTNNKIKNPGKPPNEVVDVVTIEREGPTNGTIKLVISPNNYARVGDEIDIKTSISTPGGDLSCFFTVIVDNKISTPKEIPRKNSETFPNLPNPQKAYENPNGDNKVSWSDLNWDGKDIVKVIINKSDDNDLLVESIIVNMDSYVLKKFISKNRIKNEKELQYTSDKYFLSIYLHSLFLFSILQKMRKNDESLKQIEVDEFVSSMVKPYSSFLLYENYHITKLAFDD